MTTIDEYIATFPADVQQRLRAMRETIARHAPGATEAIAYGVPTFRLNGNLVHFAAFKRHIGFYPGPSGIAKCEGRLTTYKRAKGSVQFPLEKPLPLDIVAQIVKFRVTENMRKKKSPARGE